MDKLKDLISKRDAAHAAGQAIIAAAQNEQNRSWTPEEKTKIEGYLAEVKRFDAEILAMKAQIETERTFADMQFTQKSSENKTASGTSEERGMIPTPGLDVNDDNRHRFSCLGEQLRAVARHAIAPESGVNPKLLYWTRKAEHEAEMMSVQGRASGMSIGTPADGGFAIMPDYINILMSRAEEGSVLLPQVTRLPLSVGTAVLPYWDETSRVTGSRMGGIRVYRKAEAAEATASKPKLGSMTVTLEKLIGLCYMTDELIEDSPLMQAYVGMGFEKEFGWMFDNEFINGTGVGESLGFMNHTDLLVTVAKEAGQTDYTITHKNLVMMRKRMLLSSRKNAIWIANQDIEDQLEELTVPVGTGGAVLIRYQADAVKPGVGKLLNFPIYFMEQTAALGTSGDISFIDPKDYLVFEKPGMKYASSIHVKFSTEETAFKFTFRIIGRPARKASLTPANGSSNKLSSFITLANRKPA